MELDRCYLWMDRSGSVGSATVPGVTLSSHVRDVTLVSGKFGWTWENLLATFRAGWVTGEVDVRTSATGLGPLASSSERQSDGTAGHPSNRPCGTVSSSVLNTAMCKFNADQTLTSTPVGLLAPVHAHAGVDI